MALIADVFPEMRAAKNMVREMSKEPCFRGPLDREHGKSVETLFQSERKRLYKIFNHCDGSCIGKVSFTDTQNPKTVC